MSTLADDPYIRLLLGAQTIHAAFNYVVQGGKGQDRAAIIGSTSFAKQMSFGGIEKGVHTLVCCDVLIRPHLVIASDHLTGTGAAGILTSSDGLASAEAWMKHGTILIKNT
jgi:hypothetical protein